MQYQTDLPPLVPIITQFNSETGYCSCCRPYWQGRHPDQTSDASDATGATLGPVVWTLAAEIKHRRGVRYRHICDFLQTYCQRNVCPAAFIRAEQGLADLAKPTYDLLSAALRQSQVVPADETGWRVGRLNAWLWVFSSKQATVYVIRTGADARGHPVPHDLLGPNFAGYRVVAGWKTYAVLEVAKGRCNGHRLRRCNKLRDTAPTTEQQHSAVWSNLLKEALDLASCRDQVKAEDFVRSVQASEDRLDDWLEAPLLRRTCRADGDRLDSHLHAHRGAWLVLLHDPEVPPTNNHAEHMLRPAVITRQVGDCNNNLLGALVHRILSSIRVTCHRQGQRFLDLAKQLWPSHEPQAIPVATLPEAIR